MKKRLFFLALITTVLIGCKKQKIRTNLEAEDKLWRTSSFILDGENISNDYDNIYFKFYYVAENEGNVDLTLSGDESLIYYGAFTFNEDLSNMNITFTPAPGQGVNEWFWDVDFEVTDLKLTLTGTSFYSMDPVKRPLSVTAAHT